MLGFKRKIQWYIIIIWGKAKRITILRFKCGNKYYFHNLQIQEPDSN